MKLYRKIYFFKERKEMLKREEISKICLLYFICNYMNILACKKHFKYFLRTYRSFKIDLVKYVCHISIFSRALLSAEPWL